MRAVVAVFLLVGVTAGFASVAPTPPTFNYQAKLTDSGGAPLQGTHTMFFSVYTGGNDSTPGSGTLVYAESANVAALNGVLSHAVGTGTLLSTASLSILSWLSDSPYFLEVAVDTDSNVVLPRSSIQPVPLATRADDAVALTRGFVVAPGHTVSAGDVVSLFKTGLQRGFSSEITTETIGSAQFNNATTDNVDAGAISGTQFVIAYRDLGNAGSGTAIVGTVSGGTITYGAEAVFNTANTFDIALAVLDSTKVVIVYTDGGASSFGQAIVGTVSGSTISFGSEFAFNSASTARSAIAALSSGVFAVAFLDVVNGNRGFSRVGVVSGSNIAYSGFGIFNPAATGSPKVAGLTSLTFAVAFPDENTSGAGLIVTDSAGVLTTSSKTIFNTPGTSVESMLKLSSTKTVIAFRNSPGSDPAQLMIANAAGTLTYGTKFQLTADQSTLVRLADVSSTRFVSTYFRDDAFSIEAVICDVSGNTIFLGAPYSLGSGFTSNGAVCFLAPDKIVSVYPIFSSGFSTLIGADADVVANNTILGIATADGSAGDTVPVVISGVAKVNIGLTPGFSYYATQTGSLTDNASAFPRMGRAVSTTELFVVPH